MIFIFGGYAQGKLNFALKKYGLDYSDVFDSQQNDFSEYRGERIINHFEYMIKKWLEHDENPFVKTEEILDLLASCVIISQEVGCGLVPVDEDERRFREAVGRANCLVSEKADTVYRVCCGLGLKLKGGEV